MHSFLNSDRGRVWTLIPYLYSIATRIDRKQFIYNLAVAWLPLAWIALRLSGQPLDQLIASLVLGYLAFVSIYEIGYFANDTWSATREGASARKRVKFAFGPAYVASFALVRLGLWLIVSWCTDWIMSPVWLSFYGTLIAAFVAHNVVNGAGFRSATFLQLSVMRFIAPAVALLSGADLGLLILVSILHYSLLRFLGFLDSKGVLSLPERKDANFGLILTVLLFPINIFLAVSFKTSVMLEAWLYFSVVYLLWAVLSRRFSAFPRW